MSEERLSLLRSRIRDIPDFPKEGILFRDITPLLADVEAFRTSNEYAAHTRAASDALHEAMGDAA